PRLCGRHPALPARPRLDAGSRARGRPRLFRGTMHAPPRARLRAPRGRVNAMDGPSAARPRPGSGERAPLVSVIIPTWNEARCLPTLIESLRAQTRPPVEFLVADSGRT